MANCPLVSVVIPSYNAARYVPCAIESVLEQSYCPIEINVIDATATSTDNPEHRAIGSAWPPADGFGAANRPDRFEQVDPSQVRRS